MATEYRTRNKEGFLKVLPESYHQGPDTRLRPRAQHCSSYRPSAWWIPDSDKPPWRNHLSYDIARNETGDGSLSAGRILIVDDQPQIRRFMRTTLANSGYEVDEA